MIKRRMPFQALQKAVCETLKTCQSNPVYEYVTLNTKPPYITIGGISTTIDGAKDASIYDVQMEIYAYSCAHTRREINEMIDDVATILSSVLMNLNDDKFCVIAQDIGDAITSPSKMEGYSGKITASFRIQDID